MIMLADRIAENTARIVPAMLMLLALCTGAVAVNPGSFGPSDMVTGGTELVPGSVSSVTGSGNFRSINTTGQETIINYKRFNVWEDWTVNFQQPGPTAATLNRVTGCSVSKIMGTLTSNGQVFLVNPAGIVFGKNSQISMPRMVASGLNLSNEEFRKLARNPLNDTESVRFIAPRSGGRVEMCWESGTKGIKQPNFNVDHLYLIGTQVENYAQIQGYSPQTNPYVVMAAATGDVLITNWNQQNIAVQVSAATLPPKKSTLGAGDIISLAVLDTSLVAMVSERDTRVNDSAVGPGSIGSTGNVLMTAGRDNVIGGD
ncbi:MAG TPA: filamentous hemagglutinin N-terminal domain-containing protein, partial [Sedimentisphaerales bacterium]|nr:filamentous hemagglutinin N-terminal domain-containing protein [Sedimentisphaerales bacterium]